MNNPVMNDVSAEEWERIKNFVGAQKKAPKHPLQQEMDRQEMRKPQHLDEGGPVFDLAPDQNDPFAGGKPLAPNNNPIPQIGKPAVSPDMAAFVSKLTGKAPAPSPEPSAPVAPLPGSSPAGGSPLDSNFNKPASDIMGGITPDVIARLAASLNQSNGKAQIGAGIAGIGDAIQSVGGIKGENMKLAEDTIQKNRENAMKVPGLMAEAGKEQHGLAKELGGDEPTSMRSFVAQKANAPLLTRMGFKPEEIKGMPASLIDGIRSGAISANEAKVKLTELQIQGRRADTADKEATATIAHQSAEEANAAKEREQHDLDTKLGAARDTVKDSSWLPHALGGTRSSDTKAARDFIASQGRGGAPQDQYLKTATNSMGHKIGTKDGKTWEPIQ